MFQIGFLINSDNLLQRNYFGIEIGFITLIYLLALV